MNEKLLLDYRYESIQFEPKEDELKFLDLTGRKTFYSQGIFGQGIIVAVLDTGINDKHPELKGRVLKGRNFCKYKAPNNVEDDNGHGTHVAATIGGENVGIAPKVEVLPVKILDESGGGNWGDEVLPGLEWVRKYKSKDGRRVSVVSMSLGGKDINHKDRERMRQAIRKLVEDDIAVIVAAGNSGKEEMFYPGAYDEVICVGAVDMNREKAMFSTIGNQVDVCQVGVDVMSAWYKGGYKKLSGTSMATPIVSGIAALISCKHSLLFGSRIKEDYLWKNLKMNTKDIGMPGVDKIFGAGFCTLQPLEAKITASHNNNYVEINGKKITVDETIKIMNSGFKLPIMVINEGTGCVTDIDLVEKKAKLIF